MAKKSFLTSVAVAVTALLSGGTDKNSNAANLEGLTSSSIDNSINRNILLMKPVIDTSIYIPSYDQIIYLGLRSIDDEEQKVLDGNNIQYYTQDDINSLGIKKVMKEINSELNNYKVHISFDVDVLDPKYIPCTGTPVDNGMDLQDCHYLLDNLVNNQEIISLDFVEFNPMISNEEDLHITLDNCMSLLSKFH